MYIYTSSFWQEYPGLFVWRMTTTITKNRLKCDYEDTFFFYSQCLHPRDSRREHTSRSQWSQHLFEIQHVGDRGIGT